MSEEAILEKGFVFEGAKVRMKKDEALFETEVIEKVKRGDREAYQEIVVRYMKRAYYIALGFVHNSEDALDLSQEAFIRAFRKLKRFNIEKPFFPWFYQLLKNLCIDHIKRSRGRTEIPLNGVQILSRDKDDREMKEILWKGIDSLPLEQKEVILLRYFQQFSYREIADIMKKPVGTVMSSLYYAKRCLRDIIWKYLNME